ncbi:hypothetical protein T440DRAFT_229745 [Plenodomus tracheiphilus IPT5]|uniref:Uncharacterized protein n=1 Tax=Plenodomus tracheiphilus IPT5 TaxID=1408161 RepID=A0A6A7AWC6_9PLEO|nr:hypothetical protein T440DRAFT_229745 [Plenodomus tracheiphilus IPT5]
MSCSWRNRTQTDVVVLATHHHGASAQSLCCASGTGDVVGAHTVVPCVGATVPETMRDKGAVRLCSPPARPREVPSSARSTQRDRRCRLPLGKGRSGPCQ